MSMFSPQIGTVPLVGLCRRMSTALEAGIDARTAWSREAQRATGALRRRLLDISDAVNQGYSLTDALVPTGDYFPPLLREMTAVGEQTGHLDSVFAQLADHYQTQVTMRRSFLGVIAWPVIELLLSLGVIGLAIWLPSAMGLKVDLLGFGLTGTRGLAIYATLLAMVAGSIWLFVRAARRGVVWIRPIQRLVLKIPGVGRPLQTLALSRLAWTLHLTMNTSMDVRQSLALSLRSTQNARYTDKIPVIDAEIAGGSSIHEAFRAAGGYPADFLDTLAVGEQSGKMVESMGTLARQYQDRARIAMTALAVVAGVGVMILIAGLIIAMIFRIFITSYLGPINDALNNMR
jgi:type II secretory pathway component PulF